MEGTGGAAKTLVRKLGLQEGMRIRVLNPPGDYWALLGASRSALGVVELSSDANEDAGFTHLFAADAASLDDAFARARAGMVVDGMVWASWPKKASGVPSEVGRSEVMAAGKRVGLVDVKVCSVSPTWSGLKFVIPVASRTRSEDGTP